MQRGPEGGHCWGEVQPMSRSTNLRHRLVSYALIGSAAGAFPIVVIAGISLWWWVLSVGLVSLILTVERPSRLRAKQPPAVEPTFPIRVTWRESGEIESYDRRSDLVGSLEDFDSDRDGGEADVVDARGRAVWLRVCIWEGVCELRLDDRASGDDAVT